MVLVAFSNVLLKKGAVQIESGFRILTNRWVITGYLIMGIALFLNIYGLKKVPLNHMAFILPAVYILVPLFSKWFFHEDLGWKKILGSIFIIFGTLIYNM
jgi:drug/metabolite transporter (DMT)-like permease